jgi:adenylate cyclase
MRLSLLTNPATVARILGLSLLAALLAIRAADPLVVSAVRNQGFDLMQRLKPRPATQQPVVIVDIDEKALARIGQWPWPRSQVAALVDRLAAAGAITVGFDIVFAEEDRLSPDRIAADNPGLPAEVRAGLAALGSNEDVLAAALRRTRVVVGETAARDARFKDRNGAPIARTPSGIKGLDPDPFLLDFPQLVQNLPRISAAAAGHGVFTVDPDADGIFRRMPLVMKVEGEKRLSLGAEILRIATGGRAFLTRADQAGIAAVVIGGVEVPTDPNGRIWPWFNASSPARYVSAGDIMAGEADLKRIAGRMALVGTSAVGLEDYRATPVASAMPGVEIHAQIIENILAKQFLLRPNFALGMEMILAALLGIAAILLYPRLGATGSLVLAATLLPAILGGAWWAFSAKRMLVDATFPAATLTLIFMLMATANYLREERQKRQIRTAFGQYLAPAMVDRLAGNPDQLRLGGETRELTLLFTDVRGFTAISESYKKNPQGLTRLMNLFLNALSKPILDMQGTIDKYMGDAIMAFWNAPVDQADHAMRGCRAALTMVERLAALNEERKRAAADNPGEPVHIIKIGIGLNSGECVVGNMGSDLRFDYTALGDTVNLASRLEGLSKPYGFPIILGDNTAKTVGGTLATMEVDLIRVKGKSEPENIHALFGGEEMAAREDFSALRALNRLMLSQYRLQEWGAAQKALEEIAPISDRLGIDLEDYLFIYETRISEFRANPPGRNWDGVYTATTK